MLQTSCKNFCSELYLRTIGQNYWSKLLVRTNGCKTIGKKNWSELLVGTVNGQIGQHYRLEQIVIGQIDLNYW